MLGETLSSAGRVKFVILRASASCTVSGATVKMTGLASVPKLFAMKTGMKVISGGSIALKFCSDSSNLVPIIENVV
jgi:hypothetical protein